MIRWHWERQGGELTLEVAGHAGSAPVGEDLICAGVTTLVYALARRVQEWEEILEEQPQILLEPGRASIRVKGKERNLPQLEGAFQTVSSGLELLAEQYPECVMRYKIRYPNPDCPTNGCLVAV